MDPFDLLMKGDLPALEQALAATPALATARHVSGASLIAFAHYLGKPEAVPAIRAHVTTLDPNDAVILGDLAAVEDALGGGWDPNVRAPDGFTPLALAAFFRRPEVFDRLLPLTADLDAAAENPQRVAAIHAATAQRQTAMVEKLVVAGASPDLEQADGFTPLQAAAEHGDTAIVALLVLAGADPRKQNANGMDAAAHAVKGGHDWLAERLKAVSPR